MLGRVVIVGGKWGRVVRICLKGFYYCCVKFIAILGKIGLSSF